MWGDHSEYMIMTLSGAGSIPGYLNNHIMLTGSSRIKKQHTFLTKTAQVLHFHLWKNFISLSKSVKSDTLIDAIANLNVSACNSEIMFFV